MKYYEQNIPFNRELNYFISWVILFPWLKLRVIHQKIHTNVTKGRSPLGLLYHANWKTKSNVLRSKLATANYESSYYTYTTIYIPLRIKAARKLWTHQHKRQYIIALWYKQKLCNFDSVRIVILCLYCVPVYKKKRLFNEYVKWVTLRRFN